MPHTAFTQLNYNNISPSFKWFQSCRLIEFLNYLVYFNMVEHTYARTYAHAHARTHAHAHACTHACTHNYIIKIWETFMSYTFGLVQIAACIFYVKYFIVCWTRCILPILCNRKCYTIFNFLSSILGRCVLHVHRYLC